MGNSWALAFTLALGLIGYCRSSFAFDPSDKRFSANSDCIGAPNPDPNADAIVEDVFKKKPQELVQEHIINQNFFNDIRSAKYLICHDATWEVITLDRTPPLTIFDSDFLGLLGVESQSLVLGQYLANDHAQLNPTDLHTSLMRHVLRQNLSSSAPTYSLAQLANNLVGSKVDLGNYEARQNYQRQWQTLFLQSLYFLVFHEFCHIHAKDLERRKEIAKLPTDTPENIAKKESMLVALENRADSCAIDIINRDESQFKASPISFISVFLVSSTQAVLEKAIPQKGPATHPAPQARLANTYNIDLDYIQKSPDLNKYRPTLDGMYQHFSELVPK